MTTREELLKQLKDTGAPRDRPVIVHTSLRAVGETEGRGEGFLQTLIDYFTAEGGLLLIPTHTWKNKGLDCITLDMQSSATCIGTLPDLAAARPDAHRSENPTHSVAVFGDPDAAEEYILPERTTETTAGIDSCYGRLYTRKGMVLLVGVGQERNTYLHCVEELLGVDRLSHERVPMTVRRRDGSIVERGVYSYSAGVSRYFPKLEPVFRKAGCITDGRLGLAPVQLCDAAGQYDAMKRLYEKAAGRDLLADGEPVDPSLY